ncbi:hypothetical protein BDV59DRAFT_2512 [Aspergillus ambiguus]|uniref:uncharacterized protein n=1 Tax=Aspergillus ambiguus TaxID=176160 RepID=UPI003CCDAF60
MLQPRSAPLEIHKMFAGLTGQASISDPPTRVTPLMNFFLSPDPRASDRQRVRLLYFYRRFARGNSVSSSSSLLPVRPVSPQPSPTPPPLYALLTARRTLPNHIGRRRLPCTAHHHITTPASKSRRDGPFITPLAARFRLPPLLPTSHIVSSPTGTRPPAISVRP